MFINGSDNIEKKIPTNSDTTREIGQGMVYLHGAENQAMNSRDNRPYSSKFAEACVIPTRDTKFLFYRSILMILEITCKYDLACA